MSEYYSTKSEDRTSIMDVSCYREFCLAASQDEGIFRQFKRYKEIQVNIESVSPVFGEKYLSLIRSDYPFLLNHLPEFAKNDWVGSPWLAHFPEIGDISPTTLRYTKVLGEIVTLFGPIEGWDIAEIGGGYGGQCRLLSSYARLKSYTIIDLFETLCLAKKYLSCYGLDHVSYLTMDQLPTNKTYDLVISNYAFTECQQHVQKKYIEAIIRNSKRGYLTCNFTSQFYNVTSYDKKALIDLLKSYDLPVQILEETPYTGGPPDLERSIVLVWQK